MRVAILGTGLIGGSIGLALKANRAAEEIVAYDASSEAAAAAVEHGAADRAASSPASAAAGAGVVFVAVPVGAIASVIEAAAPGFADGAIVTDVGSTKARVVRAAARVVPPGRHFIGGHPMAGSEEEGIAAARPDLFRDAWWILTPGRDADPEAYGKLRGLLGSLGARVMALDATEHDAFMAVVSHLPQLVATTLMNTAAEAGEGRAAVLALAAGGFRDVTRVAASNPEIWLDICRENGDAIVESLDRFIARLRELRDLVDLVDAAGIRSQLQAAREARRSLPGKDLEGEPFEIRIAVPDRPGVLSEVTTAVGGLGINIEDLSITHASEGGRGTLHLEVTGEQNAARVAAVLTDRGFVAKVLAL